MAQGIGLGLATGLTYIPALGVVAHHFNRRRALVMGIVASASSLGGIVHPIMLNQLIHGSVGFAWGVRISAFLNCSLLLIANMLMTTRLPPKAAQTFTQQLSYWKGFFKDTTFVTACAGTFLFVLGVFFPMFFIQLEAVDRGVSETLAFYMVCRPFLVIENSLMAKQVAIFYAASAFGRILPTLFVEKVGTFNLIVPCTLACGILIYCLSVAVVNAAGSIMMSILCGFFSGACERSIAAPVCVVLTLL